MANFAHADMTFINVKFNLVVVILKLVSAEINLKTYRTDFYPVKGVIYKDSDIYESIDCILFDSKHAQPF